MALIKKVLASDISRRDFLKGSAAFGAAAMALAGSGSVAATNALAESTPANAVLEGGKWVAAACPHNCGGKCLVRAYIKDGVILRQSTDNFNTDDDVNRQQERACCGGRGSYGRALRKAAESQV